MIDDIYDRAIYLYGKRINFSAAFALIKDEAEVQGYDPEEVKEMLSQALKGIEDFNDQLCCDFGIEVVA